MDAVTYWGWVQVAATFAVAQIGVIFGHHLDRKAERKREAQRDQARQRELESLREILHDSVSMNMKSLLKVKADIQIAVHDGFLHMELYTEPWDANRQRYMELSRDARDRVALADFFAAVRTVKHYVSRLEAAPASPHKAGQKPLPSGKVQMAIEAEVERAHQLAQEILAGPKPPK